MDIFAAFYSSPRRIYFNFAQIVSLRHGTVEAHEISADIQTRADIHSSRVH